MEKTLGQLFVLTNFPESMVDSIPSYSHDPKCRFCDLEPKTSSHLLNGRVCEVLSQICSRAFKSYFLGTDKPIWTVNQLLSFLKDPEMVDLELEDPYEPLTQLTPHTHTPRAAGDPPMGQSHDP